MWDRFLTSSGPSQVPLILRLKSSTGTFGDISIIERSHRITNDWVILKLLIQEYCFQLLLSLQMTLGQKALPPNKKKKKKEVKEVYIIYTEIGIGSRNKKKLLEYMTPLHSLCAKAMESISRVCIWGFQRLLLRKKWNKHKEDLLWKIISNK